MRLVSSQSFPHLWKKLWKFHQIRGLPQLLARIYADFGRRDIPQAR
jgi:hypothetical protein